LIINTIASSFAGGGSSSNSRKRHLREIMNIRTIENTAKEKPPITFTDNNFKGIIKNHDDPMVIRAIIVNVDVGRILVD